MVQGKDVVQASGLVYVTDSMPGIYRKGKPGKFYYEDKDGNKITAEKHLDRIKALVIPPAWQNVWIANKPNAYLQVTGIDAAGRKQYKYHSKWTSRRSEDKYFRLLEFGKALPKARKNLQKDLRRKNFDERKVLAISVDVLQKTLIRVGNESYKQLYGSFGLTTLRDKHVKINGSKITMDFVGKKGVRQKVELNDRTLAKLVKKCRDIPGQELFQFYTNGNEHKSIDSGKINAYIKEITGDDFTAKDFRTWGGTLEAMRQFAQCQFNENAGLNSKKTIVAVLDCVAKKLGNTRAVCKSAYVYPFLLTAYENNQLEKYLKKINNNSLKGKVSLEHNEKVLLSFLKSDSK
ncbi:MULTISPECIES: DNA topoisomerase IB [unclassified Pedobacter]|uniref:DNA topoisomerase IB n=1 Tax=unclassified Pedobacter TaxID=2628915 RepID=UPI001423A6EB|nr:MULTISPECIES: DNA topoisomerase IB [unclassified Pedobacter]NII83914.1 DNA topoisomerase-1 [Pedobacter sp. SG908]NMN37788.1 DNA topoisomerase-1 [Pedobacter sp. SG918]